MTNQEGSYNKPIVLLEFPDEAKAYLDHCSENAINPTDSIIISLDPKTRVWLELSGVSSSSSTPYFSSDAHARSLRKSNELMNWLESRFQLEDALGISNAYSNALLWYSRFFIHHMLWFAELLAEANARHPNAGFLSAQGNPDGSRNPIIMDDERWLAQLTESYCKFHQIPFNSFDSMNPTVSGRETTFNPSRRPWLYSFGFRFSGWLQRAALRRMGKHRPFMAITHGYRGDLLSQDIQAAFPDIPWVIRGEKGGSLGKSAILRRGLQLMTAGMSKNNGRQYMGEYWLRILQESTKVDSDFATRATQAITHLAAEIESEKEIFSHRDVYFGDLLAAKIRTGIGTAIGYLQREITALDEVLDLVKPRMVVTPFGRRSLHALGELTQRKEIPGLLISHGSFTPIKTDLEKIGWQFHSTGLLHGTYSHSALQTPLAEAFVRQVPTKTKFLRTGPLIWGLTMEGRLRPNLREKLVGKHTGSRIVVHAGTPKISRAMHFHVYETPDEYMAALRDLVLAVDKTTDVFLIIKYRPTMISEADLLTLLPKSDRFCVSVEEPFLDVLGISDLLVSFSSTTIEEAFQNRVPVLLYGGDGRYQHVEAPDITPGIPVSPGAVYSVKRSEDLADGLTQILDVNGSPPLPPELFRKYVYKEAEIIPLPTLVGNLLAPHQTNGSGQRVRPTAINA